MVEIDVGVLLPTRGLLLEEEQPQDASLLLRLARRAEEGGVDSLWVGDSLTAKPRLEPLTTLGAVATATRRVRLGTAVLLAALRHPVALAQAAGSVDLLSGGRLTLGVGVGGAFNEAQRREWRNAGVDPRTRARRFEEVVEVARRLLRGEVVTFRGRHFRLERVTTRPTAVSPAGVPFLVACHWRAGREAQFRRAARLGDGLISISDYPHEYAQVVERVKGYAQELGRDADSLETAFYMTVALGDDGPAVHREAMEFLDRYYGIGDFWGDRWGPYGPPEATAERALRYVEAGARTVVFRFASRRQEEQLELFLERVLPLLRRA